MTTGSILKNKLGLSKLKYVAIARALYSNIRLYFVFFDTRHPNSPLTTPIMFRKPMMSSISQYPFSSKDAFAPWMLIESFNGQIETGIFISIDLSGRMGNEGLRENKIEEKYQKAWLNLQTGKSSIFGDNTTHSSNQTSELNYENSALISWNSGVEDLNYVDIKGIPSQKEFDLVQTFLIKNSPYAKTMWNIRNPFGFYIFDDIKTINKFQQGIKEFFNNVIYIKNLKSLQEITLPDFKKNAVSNLNKKYLKLRQSEGDPIINMKDVLWNESDNTVTLFFDAHPTYDKEVTNYSPELKSYRDNKYILMVQFIEVSKIIGDKETFKQFSASEQGKLVLQMINEADVKLWSSDPSFLWQGAWEYLDQVDSSVFSYKGPAGKDIWAKRHTGTKIEGLHGTKHLAELFGIIFAIYNDITIELRKSLNESVKPKDKIKESVQRLKENGGKFGCVMLNLEHEKDYRLSNLRNQIPIDNVYSRLPLKRYGTRSRFPPFEIAFNSKDEDLGYEQNPHCTVFYGLEDDADLFKIKQYVKENYPNPFILRTSHLHIFESVENSECDCLVIKCIPPKELLEINSWIKENCPNQQKYKDYIPHITLAYIKKGTCREFLNKPINLEFTVSVNDFIYSGHDKVLMENNKKIQESFVDYIKPYPGQDGFMVFKNPSNKELRELNSYNTIEKVRAVIFRNNIKDVYVSDFSLLHALIAKAANIKGKYIDFAILPFFKKITNIDYDDIIIIKNNSWIKQNLKGYEILNSYGENSGEVI